MYAANSSDVPSVYFNNPTGLVCYMTTKVLIYFFLVEKAVSDIAIKRLELRS